MLKEKCGIFGITNHPEATKLTYFGLYALQHRGQESAGIAFLDKNSRIQIYKGMGLVPEVFNNEKLDKLNGNFAIGHTRYSTTGSSLLSNAQPFVVHHKARSYSIAHNGNFVNAQEIRRKLEEKGSIFQTTMDSEIFLHVFIQKNKKLPVRGCLN